MLSVTALGKIYIWGNVPKMKWSAFAAEFEEIDENVEYIERENEFDLVRILLLQHCRLTLGHAGR